jgi:hypothetical protein
MRQGSIGGQLYLLAYQRNRSLAKGDDDDDDLFNGHRLVLYTARYLEVPCWEKGRQGVSPELQYLCT